MNSIKEIVDAVLRVVFGHNAIDNGSEWVKAHDKASTSRAEVDKIIKESERPQ